MHRLVLAVALGLACTYAPPALAFGLPGGDDPALTKVHDRNMALQKRAYAASLAVVDGLVLMQKAAGHEDEAARIQEVAERLGEADAADPASLNAANTEIKALAKRLKKTEFPSRALSADEKVWLQKAMATVSAVGQADAEVGKEALGLAGELVKLGQKNPLALMKIKDETGAVKLIGDLATEQAHTARDLGEALGRFAKSHHVDPPTAEQVQEVYQALMHK